MEKLATIEIRHGAKVVLEQRVPRRKEITVGRGSRADVVLDGREVSRDHLRLVVNDDHVNINVRSANGVVIGGKNRTGEFMVPRGEGILVGGYELLVHAEVTDRAQDEARRREAALRVLVEQVDLRAVEGAPGDLRARVESALGRIVVELGLADRGDPGALIGQLADEALGLGPIEQLLQDESVSEIMVVDPKNIYVERRGRLYKSDLCFSGDESVRTVIERIITPMGRRIDESSPMVDARLADGSRVNAVIPPLALGGPTLTIRKFSTVPLTMKDLVAFGSFSEEVAAFLVTAVEERQNIVISGGTGSGKTTLLNVLAGAIDSDERIVTIEDAAELQLPQPHVVRLESRPANAEGSGAVTIRDLVKNALRMRPDRIVVGECRGGEALDMLQAMNTGHDGSLTTTHANSPPEAISRLETLCLMAGTDLPQRAVREQICTAVNLIIQQSRSHGGARRVTAISEVVGVDHQGGVRLAAIFETVQGTAGAESSQRLQATGHLPLFVLRRALREEGESSCG